MGFALGRALWAGSLTASGVGCAGYLAWGVGCVDCAVAYGLCHAQGSGFKSHSERVATFLGVYSGARGGGGIQEGLVKERCGHPALHEADQCPAPPLCLCQAATSPITSTTVSQTMKQNTAGHSTVSTGCRQAGQEIVCLQGMFSFAVVCQPLASVSYRSCQCLNLAEAGWVVGSRTQDKGVSLNRGGYGLHVYDGSWGVPCRHDTPRCWCVLA